jgi:hypothetical protein
MELVHITQQIMQSVFAKLAILEISVKVRLDKTT